MSDNLKDILNNSNKDIDNHKLMDYLSQQLSKQDSHELEKMMADDEFINDAVEGLEQFSSIKKLPHSVDELNMQLQKQIAKNKGRKQKRKMKEQPWVYFAIILLLLLAIISYVVIKKRMNSKLPVNKAVTAQTIHLKL
jgi:hypothetical protein